MDFTKRLLKNLAVASAIVCAALAVVACVVASMIWLGDLLTAAAGIPVPFSGILVMAVEAIVVASVIVTVIGV